MKNPDHDNGVIIPTVEGEMFARADEAILPWQTNQRSAPVRFIDDRSELARDRADIGLGAAFSPVPG
jgi:hypothetical protein